MSTQPATVPPPGTGTAASALSGKSQPSSPLTGAQLEGLTGLAPLDEQVEKRIDEIEMIGEEEAAGLTSPAHSQVSAGIRYLHCSRTIHQLVTDRNRAVGVYLAVASLLWTASSALLNVKLDNFEHRVPIKVIQDWCLPATFGILTVLALFAGFLLIRTRIGLIYEVAKMNVLLGLPVGRVKRINPLSIFFIMHTLISLAGGFSGALLTFFLLNYAHSEAQWWAIPVGLAITLLLLLLYIGTVWYTTSDKKLQGTAP
jgi:hypothetical protein